MQAAYVLINCDLNWEKDVLVQLRETDGVSDAHGTAGAYDIIALVLSDTAKSLKNIITWKIRRMPHVKSTLTLPAAMPDTS